MTTYQYGYIAAGDYPATLWVSVEGHDQISQIKQGSRIGHRAANDAVQAALNTIALDGWELVSTAIDASDSSDFGLHTYWGRRALPERLPERTAAGPS